MSDPLLRGLLTSIREVQSQPRPPLHRRRRGERPFMRAASAAKKQFDATRDEARGAGPASPFLELHDPGVTQFLQRPRQIGLVAMSKQLQRPRRVP
jgi:hypothetical protein